jgi:hypothetical protein
MTLGKHARQRRAVARRVLLAVPPPGPVLFGDFPLGEIGLLAPKYMTNASRSTIPILPSVPSRKTVGFPHFLITSQDHQYARNPWRH